jgi:hypothetical protein
VQCECTKVYRSRTGTFSAPMSFSAAALKAWTSVSNLGGLTRLDSGSVALVGTGVVVMKSSFASGAYALSVSVILRSKSV